VDSSSDESLAQMFQRTLHVDAAKAEALVAGGFTSLDEVAYVPFSEFQEDVAFDDGTINELRRLARLYLLNEPLPKDVLGDEPPEVY
jgi:N utilization substance protein A